MSSLPKIDLPKYKHTLLGLNKEIHYRPFTIKEQKILLLAKEAPDSMSEFDAISQIVNLCTYGEVDVNEIPFFDLEDLFLRIRSKSVGEQVEFNYKDKVTDRVYKVKIDLDDVKVTVPEDHTKKVQLTDTIGLMMKYPTLETITQMNKTDSESLSADDNFIKSCIDYVYTEDEIFKFSDFSAEEVDDWIDSLDIAAQTKIKHFFTTMPRLRYETTLQLDKDRTETLKYEGIESFFT